MKYFICLLFAILTGSAFAQSDTLDTPAYLRKYSASACYELGHLTFLLPSEPVDLMGISVPLGNFYEFRFLAGYKKEYIYSLDAKVELGVYRYILMDRFFAISVGLQTGIHGTFNDVPSVSRVLGWKPDVHRWYASPSFGVSAFPFQVLQLAVEYRIATTLERSVNYSQEIIHSTAIENQVHITAFIRVI